MKRLLMLTYPFPPNASAGATRSERFARYLPEFGWAVDVVTIKRRSDMFADMKRLAGLDKNVRVFPTGTLDPWLWLNNRHPRNALTKIMRSLLMRLFSIPDHMLLWVPFAVRKSLEVCRNKPIDVMYTTSPPHSTHLAGLILSKCLRRPWVADFRDPWTLNAYREPGLASRILVKIERILEKGVLRNSSIVLANTKANKLQLLKAFPFLKEDKVVHLPNGWEEFPKAGCRRKEDGTFSIVHAGTFYPRFKPYSLLYAVAKWRNGKDSGEFPPWVEDIKIILLGSSEAETKQVVHDLRLEEIVELKPWVALEEARKTMCEADMLWASLGTSSESSTYIPSKLFEYIAAKRPILGFFPEGEAEKLIRETRTGLVFADNDSSAVIQAIYEAVLAKASGEPSWFNPDAEVIGFYHIKNIVLRFSRILDNSLQAGRALRF